MKFFYTHLVDIESIIIELDKMNLDDKEKLHLAELMDSSLHHTILDAVLSELSKDDKVKFVQLLKIGQHDKIWEFLNNKVDHVEDKIKNVAEELTKELHKDIKKAKEQ